MQKWEYCVITAMSSDRLAREKPYYVRTRRGGKQFGSRVVYFTENIQQSLVMEGTTWADKLTQAISQLGDEGWEMVGCGNVAAAAHSLYFKRPKP
jgi:hypothetical protein